MDEQFSCGLAYVNDHVQARDAGYHDGDLPHDVPGRDAVLGHDAYRGFDDEFDVQQYDDLM